MSDDSSPENQKSDDSSPEKQMSDDSPEKQMSDDDSTSEKERNKNKKSSSKREEISSSDEDAPAAKTEVVSKEFKKLKTLDERKKFIKQKFLVDMPEDFYQFWDLCKKLSADKPKESFKQAGLTLVGPYDVLDELFEDKNYSENEYLLHWRYYYDPPEFQVSIHTGYSPRQQCQGISRTMRWHWLKR